MLDVFEELERFYCSSPCDDGFMFSQLRCTSKWMIYEISFIFAFILMQKNIQKHYGMDSFLYK